MITSTKGSPNNIIHPTRARNTGFGKENFGRVMMSVGSICSEPMLHVIYELEQPNNSERISAYIAFSFGLS